MKFIVKLLTTAAVALGAAAGGALAEYPDRPVTIIVPWGAGGGTDTIIRVFAIGFEEAMGQPINVVNRDGGSGVVGHAAIAQSRPDGYTLGACTPEITYFKPVGLADITPENFTLISRLALIPAGLTVAKDSEYKDLPALIEAFRAEPAGTFTSSGSGIGGTWHMATAGLLRTIGEPIDKIDFIPSKGGAPALQDLVSGGLNLFTGSPVEAKALADAGEVNILAIMSDERSPAFPDVPTLKESGIDFSIANWFSLCGPAGLPEDITARIAAAAGTAHASAVVQDALAQRGITPYFDGPEAFAAFATDFSAEAGELLGELGLVK
ncbi:tripartite tricarboxylate transporter substrate binding protein [Tropicimonas sp.]|uniref:tripartite tricarboxylate transporter substrate binding protein n=1 Tax=Tropicimonas sp. TaxID=2067044 RepID=UPI003A86A792